LEQTLQLRTAIRRIPIERHHKLAVLDLFLSQLCTNLDMQEIGQAS